MVEDRMSKRKHAFGQAGGQSGNRAVFCSREQRPQRPCNVTRLRGLSRCVLGARSMKYLMAGTLVAILACPLGLTAQTTKSKTKSQARKDADVVEDREIPAKV